MIVSTLSRDLCPPRRWRPTPLLWVTFAVHSVALALLVWQPMLWPWITTVVIANHVILAVAGMLPRCRLLGHNWTRLPEAAQRSGLIAITIDDGPDPEVTPQVLDLLDHYHATATFFCIGVCADRYPDLCREIMLRGHAVENHSQNHRRHFSIFGPRGMTEEIIAGQETLTRITGQCPLFFRPTAGLRNPFLEPILARRGLILASWTRRAFDTRNRNAVDVTNRLLTGLAAGDILLLHDGHAARTKGGEPIILAVLPRLLDAVASVGLRTTTLRFMCQIPTL